MSTLFVYAVRREGSWLAQRAVPTLELGVGKIAAAMNLAIALAERRPEVVLQFGVCGAYPARHLRAGLEPLELLDTCVVVSETLVDEGVQTPDGFLDLARLGFAEPGPIISPGNAKRARTEAAGRVRAVSAGVQPITADVERSGAIASLLGCPLVGGATVSTCAGTEALSQAYAARSGAQVESMEGGAVAAVCRRFGVPHVQLRVVSNRTGDRGLAGWDLDGAIERLTSAVERVLAAGVM